jgi:uncharacterized membrane protein
MSMKQGKLVDVVVQCPGEGAKMESKTLYEHVPHEHVTRNVNRVAETEQMSASFNRKIAVGMTHLFSSMWTFWIIVFWIALWVTESFLVPTFTDKMPWPMLLALASVPQLPLMIVIMVGQSVLGRKQELQAEEAFLTTQKTYHDIEQMMLHLDKQDEAILQILTRLEQLPAPKTVKKTEVVK